MERTTDHVERVFDWAVFRPQSVRLVPSAADQLFELAAGFFLTTASPRRYNILFHDRASLDKIIPPMTIVNRLWLEFLQSRNINPASVTPDKAQELMTEFEQAQAAPLTQQYQDIMAQFYWVEGVYKMAFWVEASRPDRTFKFDYEFSLSAAESDLLRANCLACLLAACLPTTEFNFANPTYT